MKLDLKARQSGSTKELKSSLQTFGPVLKERASEPSATLTPLPCLRVGSRIFHSNFPYVLTPCRLQVTASSIRVGLLTVQSATGSPHPAIEIVRERAPVGSTTAR